MTGINRTVLRRSDRGGLRGGVRVHRTHRYFIWTTVLLLLAVVAVACQQQGGGEQAGLPDTGFTVLPQFTAAYEQYGPQLLGEPITGACDLSAGGLAQYFQRMRLESTGEGQEIRFYPLGEWARAGAGEQEDDSAQDYARQRIFEETGYAVRDEFLDFYEANHGEEILGAPISQQLDEGGLRVQYFRNGRLEWHPGFAAEARVQVGSLGQAHYAQAAHDVTCDLLARPVEVTAVDNVVIRASTAAPILYQGEEQVLYASVSTRAGVPVRGVMVDVVVGEPDASFVMSLGRTDEEGKVHASFDLPAFEPGRKVPLTIIAYAADGSEIGRRAHSFETWW